ncbi:MAG: sigma 54-interacting transcriptional regulator, partial [Planctomycetota bacterium JB042]
IDVRVARNFAEQDIQHPEFQFSHSVARQVAMSGDPIRASDALHDPGLRSIASIAELRVTSILCVPLRARNQVIGSIYLDHPDVVDRFDDDDLEVLSDFASAAGMALERARLYQENVERTAALESAKQEIERLNAALMKTVAEQAEELDQTKDSLEAERRAAGRRYDYANIVTQSERMEEVLRLLDRITDTDFPVLIQGESGTGKELVARAVHYNGPRSGRNFVSVNCAAMAEPLIEAELFGSVKGAFTGADRDRKGLFEIAHRGTLFLDEIGDMSLEVQKRLLRVVQYGEFYRLGGKEKVRVDVRIISATHRDLRRLIAEGGFREDLYYRLNVAPVTLPPVRERVGDVPLLLRHFAAELERGGLSSVKRFSRAALEALETSPWPGTVRELQNEIKRLRVIETGRPVIELDDLPTAIREGAAAASGVGESLKERLERVERKFVVATLEQVRGNKAEAARRLGVSERGLYKILDRLGIERSTGRAPGAGKGGSRGSKGGSGAQDSSRTRR